LNEPPMTGRDIVAIGASAGGFEALGRLVGALPADLPAAVFVVVHLAEESSGLLPRILDRDRWMLRIPRTGTRWRAGGSTSPRRSSISF
jgi:two-component system chemotaxis response regulator CheB